jgi:hypothetical protein
MSFTQDGNSGTKPDASSTNPIVCTFKNMHLSIDFDKRYLVVLTSGSANVYSNITFDASTNWLYGYGGSSECATYLFMKQNTNEMFGKFKQNYITLFTNLLAYEYLGTNHHDEISLDNNSLYKFTPMVWHDQNGAPAVYTDEHGLECYPFKAENVVIGSTSGVYLGHS